MSVFIKTCPKCGAIAEYNAYYGRTTCTRCDWEIEKPEDFYFVIQWDKQNESIVLPDGDEPVTIKIMKPYSETPNEIVDSIEDSISSYLESVAVTSVRDLILDVMNASGYNYVIVEPIKPIRTIVI